MSLRRLCPAVSTCLRVLNRHRALLCLALLVGFSASNLLAQGTNAAINGQITDPQGRVVPGTEIQAVDIDTNVAYSTKANGSGIYVLPQVPPGRYRLMVRKDGFKVVNKTDITLHVQDILEQNFALEVGSVSESVTVEGSGQIINTTDASVGTVIDRKFVENIPLNGRSFQDLISMTPGVVTQNPGSGSGVGTRGDFSVNGQRTESNYYTVDGVSANLGSGTGNGSTSGAAGGGALAAGTAFGTTQSMVSVDALQEFRVSSSTYSAAYGRSPGAQFSLVTRSGTNDFHGAAFDYLRNNFFDANDWFNDYYGRPIAALRQNDFGGTFGGPVWIPGIYNGRNRTFFFASYEGLRLRQPQAASLQYVPDNYMRQSPQLQPVIRQILNAFPLQTTGPGNIDYGTVANPSLATFIQSYSLPGQIDSTSIRADHTLNPKATIFFRYAHTPSSTTSRGLSRVTTTHVNTDTYTFGATNHLTNALSNELRIGYGRNDASLINALDSFGGAVPIDLLTAMGIGGYASGGAEPFLYYSGIGSAYIYSSGSAGAFNKGRQWNFADTAHWSRGRHEFSFGIDYRRIRTASTLATPSIAAYFYNTNAVLTNQTTSTSITKNVPTEPVFNETAAFVQDEWRIVPRLSLSLGLRWEVTPPPVDAHGNDAYTLFGNISDPKSLSLAPRGTSLWNTAWYNFAPRLGGAWTAHDVPGWETVVRAGGGVFFDTNSQTASYGWSGLGFSAYETYSNVPVTTTSSQLDFTTTPSAPYTSAVVYAFPQHLQLPYTLQWNVSLEQAFGKAQTATLSYVGSNGRRLGQEQTRSVNSLNPSFGTIAYFPGGVTSSYNALQAKYQRQFAHGVQALVSYTWSHSLDFGSNYTSYPVTRGNSDFDVRNNFSAALSWDLPKARTMQFVRAVTNGWGADARVIARTAFPITLQGARLIDASTGNAYYGNVNIVPDQPIYLYGSQYPGGRKVNAAAFTLPTAPSIGNAPRNFVRGFGETQANLAIRRDFPLRETLHLQFRAETFNVLNHPNFGSVNAGLTSAAFGQALSMLNSSLGTVASQYQQGGPRSMQFALKLIY